MATQVQLRQNGGRWKGRVQMRYTQAYYPRPCRHQRLGLMRDVLRIIGIIFISYIGVIDIILIFIILETN